MALFLLVFGMAALPESNAATATASININTTYQTLEGFGAAIAWYNSYLSEHPNKREIYDVLFNGLGLDILRLRNQYRNDPNFDYEDTEIVKMAGASLGHPIKILLCSWTPPANLKSNNNLNQGTLIKENGAFVYDKFADYWYNALVAYKAKGIVPDYISIQNEPDYESADWETCVLKPVEDSNYAGYGKALDAVYSRISSLSPMPKILAPEVTGLASSSVPGPLVQNYCNNIDLTKVYGIAHHLYNGGDANNPDNFNTNFQTIATTYAGKPRFQTEYDQGTAFTTALLMHNSLTVEGVSAYFFWDLIWQPGQRPLVNIEDPANPNGWSTTKGYTISDFYYVFKHFTKFTDPGFQRVSATSDLADIKVSAYSSADKSQLTMVLINKGSSESTVTLNLNGFSVANSAVYRSSLNGTERFAELGSLTGNAVTMPAQSVATVVVYSAAHQATPTPAPLPTPAPVPTSRSAFTQIQAETYNSQSGIMKELYNDNGDRSVAYINNGDYVVYKNVDFGTGATGFQASCASGGNGGNIEIRLGSQSGTLIGTCTIPSTGGWKVFNTYTCAVSGVTGVNDLYLVFTNGSDYLFNLAWFRFTSGTTSPTPTPVQTPTPVITATPVRTATPVVTVTPTPVRTATPVATATPVLTPTPTPGAGNYVVTYSVNDWGSGATINVTIKNNTSTAVNGWTFSWTFSGNQTITNLWSGSYTQNGTSVSVTDAGYNANIPAGGGTTNFGFNINYSGTNEKPTSFTLNGVACSTN